MSETGINYGDWKAWDDQLLVEMGVGDIDKDKYVRRTWPELQLCPAGGGVFVAWMEGPRYRP